MTVVDADTWDDFRDFVGQTTAETTSEAWRFAFRGLSNVEWTIRATIDRGRAFATTTERSRYEDRLLATFQREAMSYFAPGTVVPGGNALALLARHHGLPSSFTDWSTSPYVAAYFAFSAVVPDTARVAIWTLDRDKLPDDFEEADLIDDPVELRFNTRAIRQRGLFIRVPDANTDLNDLLGVALTKITLPASLTRTVLADLSHMTLNASTLFNDLDGAARTANDRMTHGF